MSVINIKHLTKDYGNNKGVFDVSINVEKGEVYGYLGQNGAGKSTTLRHLMGFSKVDSGELTINGLDTWKNQEKIKQTLGYLPGEISLPNNMTGKEYLLLIAKMRKMKSYKAIDELLEYFEINADCKIKSMSKGMKQKIAIVSTFMHNPDVILLDEPTSGLDPLMQEKFIQLIEKEKQKGKTIIMSSHIFEEVGKVCDRIGILKSGKLVNEVKMSELKHNTLKTYKVEFKNKKDYDEIKKIYNSKDNTCRDEQNQIIVTIDDKDINSFISNLSKCNVVFLQEQKHSLEEYFMKYYGGEQID